MAEEKLQTYQEQLLSLASELLLTEERERRRLATDLHDSIGQVLAIAKLKLDTLQSTSPMPGSNEDLNEICELVGQATEQTRYLTFELSPSVLYQFGLEAAVESLVERVQQQHNLSIQFTACGQPKPLPEELRVLLYRAVQELLVNIVKHARARRVTISIGRENDYTQILVADDGMGFDLTEIDSHHTAGKFGLFSIRERLHHLGGRFEVVSKPGQGTKVTVAAPYAQSGKVRRGR
jgi:signal transduction histidine kinase